VFYDAETWSKTQALQKRLDAFERRCIRHRPILRVSFRDLWSNVNVRL